MPTDKRPTRRSARHVTHSVAAPRANRNRHVAPRRPAQSVPEATLASPTADNPEALVDLLQTHLLTGKFDDAREELLKVGITADEIVARVPDFGAKKIRAVAVVSEILFAFGNDDDARRLLKPYADQQSQSQMLVASIEARHKLQLAEYHYSLFDAARASELANRILKDAQDAQNARDVGECRYYLARFALRQNLYSEASEHSMVGLEVFHRMPERSLEKMALYWQTGRVLRVRGTALWWLGRLHEATAVLYLSAWVLRESGASSIYVGDALHALGRLLRSLGPGRYQEAREVLEKACEHYANHDLKRTRALIDLARTLCNTGLQKQKENDSDGAESYFEDSQRKLEQALDLTEKYCGTEEDIRERVESHDGKPQQPTPSPNIATIDDPPIVWLRERLDALIWTSWLHQEAKPLQNLPAAYIEAEKAFALAEKLSTRPEYATQRLSSRAAYVAEKAAKRPEYVEAALVFGHSAMVLKQFDKAEGPLKKAANDADVLDIRKLRFHAYLRLAQFACRASQGFSKAEEYFEAAMSCLGDDHRAFGGYLQVLSSQVEEEVKALVRNRDHFTFTMDQLVDSRVPDGKEWNRLKVLRAYGDNWALAAAIHREGSVAKAIEFLDISQGSVREIRTRYETVLNAQNLRVAKGNSQEADGQ